MAEHVTLLYVYSRTEGHKNFKFCIHFANGTQVQHNKCNQLQQVTVILLESKIYMF